jgi:hypothetical protein
MRETIHKLHKLHYIGARESVQNTAQRKRTLTLSLSPASAAYPVHRININMATRKSSALGGRATDIVFLLLQNLTQANRHAQVYIEDPQHNDTVLYMETTNKNLCLMTDNFERAI